VVRIDLISLLTQAGEEEVIVAAAGLPSVKRLILPSLLLRRDLADMEGEEKVKQQIGTAITHLEASHG